MIQRYHSLDALRAAMMLLGLVLHSAAAYTQTPLGWAWPYHDAQRSVVFDLLLFFIHLFRMPVFFVVAGFFGALLYRRDGVTGFVRNRARRVALPLAIFWVVDLPLTGLGFVFAARMGGGAMPWEYIPRQPLVQQPIFGHLWFLYDLLLFYAAALVIVRLGPGIPEGVRRHAGGLFRRIVTRARGALLLGLVSTLTLLPMQGPGLETSSAILPPMRILVAYGVFFAFGWLLYGQRDVLNAFGARWRSLAAAGGVTSIAYLGVIISQRSFDPRAWHLSGVALAGIAVWLLIFAIVGLFVRHMEKPRPLVRYLSDASYWMYLVHLAPITWTMGLLARSGAPAVVKFAIVLSVTTAVTTVTYHFFVRSTVVGELLNGRRYPRGLSQIARATPAGV